MCVWFVLCDPSDAPGKPALYTTTQRGKKLRDFEELVAKCTTVLTAWCESVETYVTAEREQPPSPFAEVRC